MGAISPIASSEKSSSALRAIVRQNIWQARRSRVNNLFMRKCAPVHSPSNTLFFMRDMHPFIIVSRHFARGAKTLRFHYMNLARDALCETARLLQRQICNKLPSDL